MQKVYVYPFLKNSLKLTACKSYTGCLRIVVLTYFSRTLQELSKMGFDEDCDICSSKDIVQILFHAEIINIK